MTRRPERPKQLTGERAPREVIADQLLTALDDKGKVAILADREMLDFLISAAHNCDITDPELRKYRDELVQDMKKLRASAFG